MKMVAAAKMRKAQERMEQARPYTNRLVNVIHHLLPDVNRTLLPLLDIRTIQRVGYVVVTSDRGLAGSFNTNVVKKAELEINDIGKDNVDLFCIGKKARDYFTRRNYNIEKSKNIFSEDGKKFWFEVFIYGGKKGTGLDVIDWSKKIEELGAGEILLTSIDRDGTKDGYDILLTNEIVHAVGIPVIASGGCGKPEDMIDIFKNTEVNAALAASIFHYETHSVNRVKEMIKENGINVRY